MKRMRGFEKYCYKHTFFVYNLTMTIMSTNLFTYKNKKWGKIAEKRKEVIYPNKNGNF